MITVHHLNNSRAQRILWLLEELELPYEIKHYTRDPKTMFAPPALKAIHPLGKSPVITDGDAVIAESGAIVEYIIDRYGIGRLRPPTNDSPDMLRYRYYLHYAEGSLMPLMLMTLVFARMAKQPAPFFVKPILKQISQQGLKTFVGPQVELHLNALERDLDGRSWLAGDELTGADIQMSFPVEAAAARAGLHERYPNLSAYLERIRNRPAYQRALGKGGPFKLG